MYYLYKSIDPHITFMPIGQICWDTVKEDAIGWEFLIEQENAPKDRLLQIREAYSRFKSLNRFNLNANIYI